MDWTGRRPGPSCDDRLSDFEREGQGIQAAGYFFSDGTVC